MTNEQTRPDCVPEGARWTYATDGLGRRVPIWVDVGGVLIFDPDCDYCPWTWCDEEENEHRFDGNWAEQLTPSLAAECRALLYGEPAKHQTTAQVFPDAQGRLWICCEVEGFEAGDSVRVEVRRG